MNKEVIYLEPEDDITDILTKLQQAEQKLVALVPPKKATMLRSAVNMKLVARVAKECEKIAVIVTADPAIVKMAMAARIPVAKTLQSRPIIPTEANVRAAEAEVQMIDENGTTIAEDVELFDEDPIKTEKDPRKTPGEAPSEPVEQRSKESADTLELTDDALENSSNEPKKAKNGLKKSKTSAKSSGSATGFAKYRKLLAIGIPVVVVLALVLVWAFVFAPAATITVAVKSSPENFSETVRFTPDPGAENIAEGVFFVEKQTLSMNYNEDLIATGEENAGEKATGKVKVTFSYSLSSYYSETDDNAGFSIQVPEGAAFTTNDGREYRSTEASAIYSWKSSDDFPITWCDNTVSNLRGTCRKTIEVPVEAVAAGEEYNISAITSYWHNYNGATVTNSGAITGGTTKMVKCLSQEDVTKAKDALVAEHTIEGREMLLEDINDDLVPIESSYTAEAGELTITPEVGEEVKDGVTPSLKVTINYSVLTVELSKIKEYVDSKVTVSAEQKIYSYGKPYFERFTAIEEPARLKTVVGIGPIVSEDSIFEKAAGRKTGDVQSLLRSIDGVSSVEIKTPYFWVWSVPKDRSKVTINLKLEDEE